MEPPAEDDQQTTDYTPRPMLPPFRRRPAAPPPPPPSSPPTAIPSPKSPAPKRSSLEPPRRSLGEMLPRRSLLAPEVTGPPSGEEYPRGRDSEESKGTGPESEKPKDRRRKKRRSRILSELRPVEGPHSVVPSVPAVDDDDSENDNNPLEAMDSGARAKEAFAAQRVRMRKSYCPDLWIYMKNGHPLFGICAAHRHHPYKRGDRFLVLLVALLVALLLCGLYAIRDCCSDVLDAPVAVISRRLVESQAMATKSYLRGGRRMESMLNGGVECLPFYGDCSAKSAVCAEGSTCTKGSKNGNSSAQCMPVEISKTCSWGSELSCPTGWTCSQDTSLCIPASDYVCYLDKKREPTMQLATGSGSGTFTAIEAIFQILKIAADRHAAKENQYSTTASGGDTRQQSGPNGDPTQQPSGSSGDTLQESQASSATSSSSTTSSPTSSPSTSPSPSTPSTPSPSSEASSAKSEASSTSSTSTSISASKSSSASRSSPESSSVKVTLTKPVNGGVYTLSSTMLIEWHLTLLSGPDPGLNHFRVDFSADNGAFDTIAANVSAVSSSSSSQDSNATVFQYEWDLAGNTSWLCTTCVLRLCALDVESVADESLCMRSDGKSSTNSNRRLQSTTISGSSSSDDITFRIVREALQCSCGIDHESFLLAAIVIAASIPIVVLLAEPLVTFYRDRQVFGLFARRDGPHRPVLAGYSTKSATRKGRVVLVLVLLGLCVAYGFVAAQITTTNFVTEKSEIVVLWVVTFAVAAAVGVLVYCTIVCFVLFNLRWCREQDQERREPSGLSEFRDSLLSDDVNEHSGRMTSPQVRVTLSP